jgi:hypothetical protein
VGKSVRGVDASPQHKQTNSEQTVGADDFYIEILTA